MTYPAVSPCVYYPESFRASYDGTLAAALGHGLAADYRWVDASLEQPGVRSYRAVGVRWLSADASS